MNSARSAVAENRKVILITILIVALAIRLAAVFLAPVPVEKDAWEYDQIAMHILKNGSFAIYEGVPTSHRAPLYPVFLSAVYLFFGHSHQAARVAQAFLSTGVCVLVYLVAKRIYGATVGLLSALLVAFHQSLLLITMLYSETLFTLLNKIDTNVDRATKIITHMRQFARKDDLKVVKIQINDVLERAFEIFSQQLKLRGIDVAWNIDQTLPEIKGDADRLEQVLINLLINARDAIEEKWDPREIHEGDKKIIIKTGTIDHSAFVEVCDTGSGIPDSIRDKIFEPFFTTKEVGKGTGLGLSISYGIVKDCGGTIEVKSTSPEGTCFILKFPLEGKE